MKVIKSIIGRTDYLIWITLVVSYLSLSKIFYEFFSLPRRLLLVWGAILLVREIFFRRSVLKNKYTILLLLFCFSNAITTAYNFPDRFVYGIVTEGYVCMFLLVFFITSMNNRQMDNQKFINKIFWIHIILSLVFAIVGLLCFIFNLSFSYENAGLELYFGLKDNRLWGFYNPNTGGSVCVISLVFSFILLKQTEKWRKLLYTNIVLQYLYMILTQSRSAWYVFLGIVVLYSVFVIILPVIKKRESINEKLKKVALNVLIILLICVSPTVIKKTIVIFPNTIIEVQNMLSDQDSSKGSLSLNRLDEEKIREQDGTNGRGELWEAGFKIFKESPVLGVGSENIVNRGEKYLSESRFENLEKGGLHNSYLMILVGSGIVGFSIMFVFFLFIVIEGFKNLIICRNRNNALLIILVFGMLANELMEARLIYNSSYLNIIFWILAGTIVGSYYTKNKEKGGKVPAVN